MTLTLPTHAALIVKGLHPPPYKIGELAYTFDIVKLTNLVHSLLPSNHRLKELIVEAPDAKDAAPNAKANQAAPAKPDKKGTATTRKQHAGKSLGAPIRTTDKGSLTVREKPPGPSPRDITTFRGRLRGELIHDMAALGRELCMHLTHARTTNNELEYQIHCIQQPVCGPLNEDVNHARQQHRAIRLPELSAPAASEEQVERRKWEIVQQDKAFEKKTKKLKEGSRADLVPVNGRVARMRMKFLSDQRLERGEIYERYHEGIKTSESWDDVGYDAWTDEAKRVACMLLKMVDRAADLHLDERGLTLVYEHPVPRGRE